MERIPGSGYLQVDRISDSESEQPSPCGSTSSIQVCYVLIYLYFYEQIFSTSKEYLFIIMLIILLVSVLVLTATCCLLKAFLLSKMIDNPMKLCIQRIPLFFLTTNACHVLLQGMPPSLPTDHHRDYKNVSQIFATIPPTIKLCELGGDGDYQVAPSANVYNVSIISDTPETQDDIDY